MRKVIKYKWNNQEHVRHNYLVNALYRMIHPCLARLDYAVTKYLVHNNLLKLHLVLKTHVTECKINGSIIKIKIMKFTKRFLVFKFFKLYMSTTYIGSVLQCFLISFFALFNVVAVLIPVGAAFQILAAFLLKLSFSALVLAS